MKWHNAACVAEDKERQSLFVHTDEAASSEGRAAVSLPEQDTMWSSFCPQWRPPPHRPLCQTDPHSAADRSHLLRWRMKTALLPDCKEGGQFSHSCWLWCDIQIKISRKFAAFILNGLKLLSLRPVCSHFINLMFHILIERITKIKIWWLN